MTIPKTNKFAHIKIVLAGFLTTGSSVRDTAEALYTADYASQDDRNEAIMKYLHQLGVPRKGKDHPGLVFDDLAHLFETVFPDESALEDSGVATFPIDMEYDQDNCDYVDLLASGVDLDQKENPTE